MLSFPTNLWGFYFFKNLQIFTKSKSPCLQIKDEVVVAKFENTTAHGAISGKTQTHQVEYYSLDMIISIGYRV